MGARVHSEINKEGPQLPTANQALIFVTVLLLMAASFWAKNLKRKQILKFSKIFGINRNYGRKMKVDQK